MELYERLCELRQKRGVSLQVVANATEISKPHIWALEQNKSSNPRMDALKQLARFYCVSLGYLTGENEDFVRGINPKLTEFIRQLSAMKLAEDDLDVLRATANALVETKHN